MTRLRALALVAALTFGCSGSDTKLERRGGPLPVGSAVADGAGGAGGAGGADSGPPVSFCEALTVIRAKCQRCHQDPPQNGAPVPFLGYEDTQAPYVDTLKYSDIMLVAVERDFMPYVALNDRDDPIMPPVEPLTGDEKTTLLTWLEQGALPVGGSDCP